MLFLLLFLSFATINVTIYWGSGCPHCAKTLTIFDELKEEFNLSLVPKESYFDPFNRDELIATQEKFGVPEMYHGAVPFTVINEKIGILGELPREKWKAIFSNVSAGNYKIDFLPTYIVYYSEPLKEKKNLSEENAIGKVNVTIKKKEEKLTLMALILAAMADSVNPCTIAVMAMLLATILMQKGRKDALRAGLLFTLVIYVCYLAMGLGIIKAVSDAKLQKAFITVVTIMLAIFTIMEFKAYFNYQPGFVSVEMPMFLRKYAKKAIKMATSLPMVAFVAFVCSLFLLPCSSGPYLLVLSMLATEKTLKALLYLIIYNFFFVLPMLFVASIIGFGIHTPEKVMEFREKHIRRMHLIAGTLMAIVLVITYFQYFA